APPAARPRADAPAPVAVPEGAAPEGGAGAIGAAGGAAPHPRLLALLSLVEDSPGLDALGPYLDDPDPAVRAAAVTALGETA
ncbi:hypothetical protein GTW71_10660, partial [Streptomyces sp. SID6041]|nr:hypothetical protein [Streptomyces sp. SID6041]